MLAFNLGSQLTHVYQLNEGLKGVIPWQWWVFDGLHIALPAMLLVFRRQTFRWLGKHWLFTLSGADAQIDKEAGSFLQVQAAVDDPSVDINAFVSGSVDEFTLLTLACYNGHEDAARLLLSVPEPNNALVNKGSRFHNWTPLHAASSQGHSALVALLLEHGANVHARTEDQQTALMAAVREQKQRPGQANIVQLLLDAGAKTEAKWMGIGVTETAQLASNNSALVYLRAYESQFHGNILAKQGIPCVASWPGVYAKLWDDLVVKGKNSELSAAVVFLPEHTRHYGQHGSDACYCEAMYGEVKPWGCKVRRKGEFHLPLCG